MSGQVRSAFWGMKDEGPLRGQCCSPGFGVRFVQKLGQDQTGLTQMREHWLVFTSSSKWLFCYVELGDKLPLLYMCYMFYVIYLITDADLTERQGAENIKTEFQTKTSQVEWAYFPSPRHLAWNISLRNALPCVCLWLAHQKTGQVWDMGYFLTTLICFNMAAKCPANKCPAKCSQTSLASQLTYSNLAIPSNRDNQVRPILT